MRLSSVCWSVAGRKYEFPDGSIYDILVPGAETGGARSEFQVTLPPNPLTPPPHIHPEQEEAWSVVDGSLDVLNGREWRTLAAGQSLAIPPGTVHTFRNRSGQNVTFRVVHTPALAFERYLDRLYWLSAMNRIRGSRNLTSLLYSSLLLDTHRQEQVLAGPGARAAVRTMAQVARLLRLRVDR
jgi:mannose-6-phosphate isomerase-like protein (cupin superfamily)